ncbi:MAG: NfeD family protein [Candidatus Alkaliphilus sp. MAG34]|nr:nodulation protein NfeD [Clostridiales bacterium]
MKRKSIFGVIILLFIFLLPGVVNGYTDNKNVYVIPIKGDITPATYYHVRHNLKIAEQDPNTVAVIFEIDTFGGRIDSAEKVSRLILDTDLHTISFVNTKAESAGVLLTISANDIAMAPGSTIGSAETIPNTEKVLSAWVGILRGVAQEKGRDEQIVIAMADKSVDIPGIVGKDKLLNVTALDAQKLRFIDTVSQNYDQTLNALNIPYNNIIMAETTNAIRLAQFVTNPYVAPILLTIGFVSFLAEVFIPGFGITGTVSLISFALYFSGNVLAGNTGWSTAIIFLAGIILLAIEAFIPGFGVVGAGGILCIIISIFLASSSAMTALVSLLVSFVLTLIIFVTILRYAPKNKHFSRIILDTRLDKSKGFTPFDSYDRYMGRTGMTVTPLRPSGTISIDGQLLDVVSEGQFIAKEELVEVSRIEGIRIVVRKIN